MATRASRKSATDYQPPEASSLPPLRPMSPRKGADIPSTPTSNGAVRSSVVELQPQTSSRGSKGNQPPGVSVIRREPSGMRRNSSTPTFVTLSSNSSLTGKGRPDFDALYAKYAGYPSSSRNSVNSAAKQSAASTSATTSTSQRANVAAHQAPPGLERERSNLSMSRSGSMPAIGTSQLRNASRLSSNATSTRTDARSNRAQPNPSPPQPAGPEASDWLNDESRRRIMDWLSDVQVSAEFDIPSTVPEDGEDMRSSDGDDESLLDLQCVDDQRPSRVTDKTVTIVYQGD